MTIGPMVQTTGNELDVDTFLNRETDLRQRNVGHGKVKLSLKYSEVRNKPWVTDFYYMQENIPSDGATVQATPPKIVNKGKSTAHRDQII